MQESHCNPIAAVSPNLHADLIPTNDADQVQARLPALINMHSGIFTAVTLQPVFALGGITARQSICARTNRCDLVAGQR